MSTPSSLATLTADDFELRLNEMFSIVFKDMTFELKLAEVRKLGHAKRAAGAFSLVFVTPPGSILRQGTYPLDNPATGRLDLFLVPLGPKDGANTYEAVFA